MAFPAIHDRRLDIDVGAAEGFRLEIMALAAEWLYLLCQQRRLQGRMGLVASLTIPRRRGMYLFLAHPCFQIVMTGQAEIRAGCQKQPLQFCLMRAVALRTFTGCHRFMFAFATGYSLLDTRMTAQAERSLFLYDHAGVVTAVRIMARKTYPLSKRSMVRSTRHFFHKFPVTLAA